MDLQALQAQLKIVIQNHQIVVSKMRNDPQNPALQKQLHDLQAEIMNLSEKQKQVVQQLRKEIEKKKQQFPFASSPGQATTTHSHSHQLQPQELRVVYSTQRPHINHRLTTPVQAVTLATKQIPLVNSLRQPVPPTVNSLASSTTTLTFKAPVGTVVLPNCTTTTALLTSKAVEHQKLQPVLVVPSPTSRSVDGPQTGVLLNLVPPIRVPQYPPPSARSPGHGTPQKVHSSNNSVPINVTSSATTISMSSPKSVSHPERQFTPTVSARPGSACGKHQPSHMPEKITNKVDQKKKDFMVALGLVTKDSLTEFKTKRLERKRRTTANPQFSNAALEEKWKNAAAAQALAPPLKRPRGRPRLDSKLSTVCSSNCSNTSSECVVTSTSICPTTTVTTLTTVISSAVTTTTTVVNGMHRQLSPPLEEKKVEQLLSGLCIVCTQPGDLIKCDTCAKQQHPGCMQPPLLSRPQDHWQCSDCQARTDSLTAVPSYVILKAAKEDEKRKLLKRSLELRLKRSQLEGRIHQLKDLSSKQTDRQSELQASNKRLETSIDQIQGIINIVRQCS